MATVLNEKWLKAEKKVDPNFEGSIHQQLGLSDILCPTCGTHCTLSDGELICLNACHLIPEAQERFHQFWMFITSSGVEGIIDAAREMKNKKGDEG